MVADLQAEFGMTRSQAEGHLRAELGDAAGDVHLPVAERPLIELATATIGKWRVGGGMKPVLLGFDLGEIDVAARWMGIRPDARLLEGLNMIERAALKLLVV